MKVNKQLVQLIVELKKVGGAHIHTVNTIEFFVYNNGTGRFNQDKFNYLKPFALRAINDGQWNELYWAMRNYKKEEK